MGAFRGEGERRVKGVVGGVAPVEGDDEACILAFVGQAVHTEGIAGLVETGHLDGNPEPAFEYLGSEGAYGVSWGFRETHPGLYAAIMKRQESPAGGARITLFRNKVMDRIDLRRSCKLVLIYRHDAAVCVRRSWCAISRGERRYPCGLPKLRLLLLLAP